jgi:N6-adenosine-specific RNA methylase IME4
MTDLIQLRGDASPTGWRLPDNMSERDWRDAGASLGRIERAVMWWIGDWWAYGEHRYGDRKAIVEAPDWTGPSFRTCMNAATVCRQFETSRRREVLSFKHHAEVAALPSSEADRLLNAAEPATDDDTPRLKASELRGQVKRIRRQERIVELAAETERASADLHGRIYNVIYADPPWKFEPYSEQTGMDRAADNHYPTMTLEAIRDLVVPAASDCGLFLWTTTPLLNQAVTVVDAWGFEYKTSAVWVKDRAGTGYWFRNQHEILLVATRGNIPAPAPGTQWTSVIEAPVGEHSAKPEIFLEIIEEYFPLLPKIELFRRGATRPGWDAWGNEATQAAE